MIRQVLLVGAGGFVGAIARYAVSLLTPLFWSGEFPLATFIINISGCFILGLFSTFAAERTPLDPSLRLFIATGFVGAYTTFSTFEYETERLTEIGAFGWATLNVVGSVAVGFLAVRLGMVLGR